MEPREILNKVFLRKWTVKTFYFAYVIVLNNCDIGVLTIFRLLEDLLRNPVIVIIYTKGSQFLSH